MIEWNEDKQSLEFTEDISPHIEIGFLDGEAYEIKDSGIPLAYRLRHGWHDGRPTVVLQGKYRCCNKTDEGFEWRDIPTIHIQEEEL